MLTNKKKIYDSVHGFIRFNDLESELIDSRPFQRLHDIHQLGIAHLVYPGATHTRFEHSLGVMELAGQMFDRVAAKGLDIPDLEYGRQIVRCAALCHDLGHLPFSHVAEKAMLGKGGHEKWTLEVIKSHHLAPVWEKLASRFPWENAMQDVINISIGEKKLLEFDTSYNPEFFAPWKRILCEMITGNFFGADRMDYLLRDAQCTGVAYGLFDYHQLIEMLVALADPEWKLGVEENGIESCEALLLARHFMHKRVYQYSSVKAYAFHMARFMKKIYGEGGISDVDSYLSLSECDVLCALNRAAKEGKNKDALALTVRSRRFRALELPSGTSEKQLMDIKKKLSLPEDCMGWEMTEKKTAKTGLSFPVLKKEGSIVDAGLCSEIVIPLGSKSWVFVDPQYEGGVQKALSVL